MDRGRQTVRSEEYRKCGEKKKRTGSKIGTGTHLEERFSPKFGGKKKGLSRKKYFNPWGEKRERWLGRKRRVSIEKHGTVSKIW